MSSISVNDEEYFITYINVILMNIKGSVTLSDSNVEDIINISSYKKSSSLSKFNINQKKCSYKNITEEKVLFDIFYSVLYFLFNLHEKNLIHINLCTNSIFYKDNLIFVGDFVNVNTINNNINYQKSRKANSYYHNIGAIYYDKYIGTYKFDLYLLNNLINVYINMMKILNNKLMLNNIKNFMVYFYNDLKNMKYEEIREKYKNNNFKINEININNESMLLNINNIDLYNNYNYNYETFNKLYDNSVSSLSFYEYTINKILHIKYDSIVLRISEEDIVVKFCIYKEIKNIKYLCKYNIINVLYLDKHFYLMPLYERIYITVDNYYIIINDCLKFLKKMHCINFIHNDLKISNIMYDKEDDKYLIIDFGLSCKIYNVENDYVLNNEIYNNYIYNSLNIIDKIPVGTKYTDLYMLFHSFLTNKDLIHNENIINKLNNYKDKLFILIDTPNEISDEYYIF